MANTPAIYRDLDLNFTMHPITNDVSQAIDTEAVKKAIRNLLQLKRYEVPFHPEVNSGINDAFFDLMNPISIAMLKDTILQVVQKYEKRVSVNDIDIRANLDGNEIAIYLNISVITIKAPIVFSVRLARSR